MNSSSIKLAPIGIWTSQLVAWGDMTAVIDRVRAPVRGRRPCLPSGTSTRAAGVTLVTVARGGVGTTDTK
jgi:hypothetical protein